MANIPAEAVLLHLHATEISVHELALNFEPSASNMDVMKRLEALQRCLKAVEDWFRIWNQIPASLSIGLTFAMFIQLVHAIVALLRLSTVNHIPAWNPTEVRNRLDLFTLLDRLAEQLELSASALSILEDDPGEDSSELPAFPTPTFHQLSTTVLYWLCYKQNEDCHASPSQADTICCSLVQIG